MIFEKIRKEIADLGRVIATSGLNLGTWGNISVRCDEQHIAITPSGVAYDTMKPEDVVIVNMNCENVDGKLKPSIELPLHSEIYKAKKRINAIVHTHSVNCTAFAVARKPIPAVCEDMVQIVGGRVEVADYFLPGSQELAVSAIKALGNNNACVLANHGLLSASGSLNETYKVTQIVEKSAQSVILAHALGTPVELSQEDVDFMRDFYLNSYGQR